ncbi:MAG: lipoate--protein ligase [Bacteroidia bacterium]|nr:lipoate--protein ligase [Bacteroidia bacterium]
MLIIDSPSYDAYFNIASEEYLLNRFPETEIFLLYVNAPSIIVGKFQNTLAEVNLDFVKEKGIKVVRRLSGGGAVYHDLGNLNFSFHTQFKHKEFQDFSVFTQPVLDLLNRLGVPAKLEGRNDLTVEGKKFSGNAKLARKNKTVQHGTILINSQMQTLAEALKINPLKFVDKSVKSNRARVTNLQPYLPKNTTNEDFKKMLIAEIQSRNFNSQTYKYTAQDIKNIQHLANTKYSIWDWNFGTSPQYNFKQAIKINAGFIELHLEVTRGIIEQAKVYGDFFATKPIEEFESFLIGIKHERKSIAATLNKITLQDYFGNVTLDEIMPLFE